MFCVLSLLRRQEYFGSEISEEFFDQVTLYCCICMIVLYSHS